MFRKNPPDLVQDDPPFGAFQFTVDEVQSVLLELDVSNGEGPDGILLLILKNCESAFARPLSLLFNRSLLTCVFPDRWKLSYISGNIEERQAQQCRRISECWFIEPRTTRDLVQDQKAPISSAYDRCIRSAKRS
jgi:hypothetical protein